MLHGFDQFKARLPFVGAVVITTAAEEDKLIATDFCEKIVEAGEIPVLLSATESIDWNYLVRNVDFRLVKVFAVMSTELDKKNGSNEYEDYLNSLYGLFMHLRKEKGITNALVPLFKRGFRSKMILFLCLKGIDVASERDVNRSLPAVLNCRS